jgi:hypothetical protein
MLEDASESLCDQKVQYVFVRVLELVLRNLFVSFHCLKILRSFFVVFAFFLVMFVFVVNLRIIASVASMCEMTADVQLCPFIQSKHSLFIPDLRNILIC